MAIKVKCGEIKAGRTYYGAGDIVDGISRADEKRLISEGFAEEVEDAGIQDDDCDPEIENMTEKQLKALAKLNDIDITGAKGKAAIKAKILAELDRRDALNNGGGSDDDDGGDEGGADA